MRILILLLTLVFNVAEARMYQWVEPETGTTQLSGKPPAWYRSAGGGPRVFVFDNGRLIDDTAVEVSDEVRQRMRQKAFIIAEEDHQKAKEKIAKSRKLKQKFGETQSKEDQALETEDVSDDEPVPELVSIEQNNDEDEIEKEMGSEFPDKSLEELKKLITDWEASQAESAKQTIEQQ